MSTRGLSRLSRRFCHFEVLWSWVQELSPSENGAWMRFYLILKEIPWNKLTGVLFIVRESSTLQCCILWIISCCWKKLFMFEAIKSWNIGDRFQWRNLQNVDISSVFVSDSWAKHNICFMRVLHWRHSLSEDKKAVKLFSWDRMIPHLIGVLGGTNPKMISSIWGNSRSWREYQIVFLCEDCEWSESLLYLHLFLVKISSSWLFQLELHVKRCHWNAELKVAEPSNARWVIQ